MMCLSMLSIPRPNGRGSGDRISIACGKCAACLTNRREEWTTRLIEESKKYMDCIFVTLTYSDSFVPYGRDGPTLEKKEFVRFLKRFRRYIEPRHIKYFAVGEYGSKYGRPHYHIILFNVSENDRKYLEKAWCTKFNGIKYLNGWIDIGKVTIASIKYVCKYHLDGKSEEEGRENGFSLMSKGLGLDYVERMKNFHEGDVTKMYVPYYQFKRRMPRYLKDKLYTSREKEDANELFEKKLINNKEYEEFIKKFPESNYFDYKQQKKLQYQKRFKIKVNKNQKL